MREFDFKELREFLTVEIYPSELAQRLDDVVFDLIKLYGHNDDKLVSSMELSEHCYFLRGLRDIFSAM
jgi:hypothetical protein